MIETRPEGNSPVCRSGPDKDSGSHRLNNEGVELEKSGKLSAALEKYRSALELDPFHGGYGEILLSVCVAEVNGNKELQSFERSSNRTRRRGHY